MENDRPRRMPNVPPFVKFVCANVPMVFDDSLSYYEALCALWKYIQGMTDVINNNATLEEEYIAKFDELKGYVENYFDNLDVQEEINNKLDSMIEDGTFDAILQPILAVYEDYNFHTLMSTKYYRSSEDQYGMQGGCMLPDNTIFQCTGNHGDNTGKILKYSADGTLLNSVTVDYGHCNGVTYNSKTGSVFITSTQNESLGYFKIYEVDPSTLEQVAEYDAEDKEFPDRPYGIAYIEEDDSFVFVNYWRTTGNKYIWKTDAEFNVIKTEEVDVEVRSTSNIGRFGNYLGVNTISDNMVMMFNFYTLKFVREVKINKVVSDVWNLTEVEWFDTRNGKIYLGFIPNAATSPTTWGGGNKVYAFFDPALNYAESRKSNTEFSPCRERYYVDYTAAYNPLRDGSTDAPFENINEALNSALRTENVTGDVEIIIKHDSSTQDTFYPFFSMKKSYKIIRADGSSSALQSMSGVYVSGGASVVFNRGLKLATSSTTYEYASINNNGNLYIDGDLTMSDGTSKVVINATNGSTMTCRFAGGGYDLTGFYGKLTNINTAYATSNSFLTTRALTPSNQMTTKIVGYRETLTETDTNKYQVPCLSPTVNLTIKFNLPNGSAGTTTTFESNYTYVSGCYTAYGVTFLDTDDAVKYMRIVVNENGALQFASTPTGGITNVRVKACTSE